MFLNNLELANQFAHKHSNFYIGSLSMQLHAIA